MREEASGRRSGGILILAFVPAAICAVVVLLQGNELSVPSYQQCAAHLSGCLTQVSSERDNALTYGWVGFGVLLALGVIAAAMLIQPDHSRRGGERRQSGPIRQRSPSPPRAGVNGTAERERAVLIRACMQVSDRVPSHALREELTDALAAAGVTPIEVPVGARFDSSRHRAVAKVHTNDASRHDLVAETERVGYVDHGQRLRYADVAVFSADGGSRS